MREIQLGLGDPPVRRYLYVGQDEGDSGACWYEYNHDRGSKTYVPQRALTGYITGLRLAEHNMGRHGKRWKLDILMDAGAPYAIRSGADTVFTRGVVLALSALEASDNLQLKEPMAIVVSPSKEQTKIVFGAVYTANGSRVKFEWDKDADLISHIRYLQQYLGDGGVADDDHQDEDSEPRSVRPPQWSGPPSGNGHSARPAGLANESQLTELRRVAGVKQVDLRDECARLFPHAVNGVEDLTSVEAIEFRKTLMAL